VEEAEAKAKDANQKAADSAVAAEGLRAGREAEEKRLLGIWEKYGSGELSSETADKAAREQGVRFQALEAETKALEGQAARLGELAKEIPAFDPKIERASEAADKAKESASDKNNQLTEAAAGRDALLKQLPCPAEADARTLADGLQRQFDGWEAGRRKADGELRDCQAGIHTKGGEYATLEQRQGDLKRQLGEKRGALDGALRREQFASEPEYLDARRNPGAVEGLKQAIGVHEDGVKGHERDRERLERELKHSQRADMEALERDEEALSRQRGDLEAARQDLNARIQSNRNLIDYLAKKAEDCARLNRDYAMVKNLSDTAGGKNVRDDGGKQSFELFVQSELFDEVIRFANLRFTEMTGGQYELVREEETRDRRSSFGLDLNVLDHFTGIPRPVHTLSGGESFMASLSLALGFADAISARAGGVTLDSMFVDEGFGTLDETALDQVMRSLSRLAQGDKLIGLISHVPEMKRRIDRQIVVKKDRLGGSRAEVIA
jgi:exonuclease SbcC